MPRPTGKASTSLLSSKHELIDKANTYLVVASAIATIIIVFSIFASVELVNKISYNNKVIGLREEARDQLQENIGSIDQLRASYIAFEDTPESIIGTSDKNSKIVLDSLPSKYDFPAFVTSIDYLITNSGLAVDGIDGTDQEVGAISSALNPTAQEIPFSLSATGSYENVQKLVMNLQKSIRPFKVVSVEISGEDDEISVNIEGISYYQPTKEIGINKEIVKSDKEFGSSVVDQKTTTTGEVSQ